MERNTIVCSPDKIHRRSYTRKNGRRVKGACVSRSRSRSRYISRTSQKPECPPGQISRSSYVRRITSRVRREGYLRKTKSGKTIKVHPKGSAVRVKASCIKDRGKTGKLGPGDPRIGPLKRGELKKFGYVYKLPEEPRRAALQRAVQALGPLNVFHKLDAVSKLTMRSSPKASAVFTADKNWVRSVYGGTNGSLHAF